MNILNKLNAALVTAAVNLPEATTPTTLIGRRPSPACQPYHL